MASTATIRQPRVLKRHRVIDRPRLYALLDQSPARIKTLVAPAGYGKSTLAEQWIARDGRRGGWYRARPASADVAALALGLARASTVFVEDCDERLREHLRALPTPAEDVETLAEILGEDLARWPADAWLVLDEYQELARAEAAERFVAALINTSPIQLLIASRQRPLWLSARGVVYEDVLELNQSTLAMDLTEAAEVLSGRSRQSSDGLVAIANGWPAVIGLASVSSAEITAEALGMPESLYGFFAEEVFVALGDGVQTGLRTLAVAPILDRELATRLLGEEAAVVVCSAARDVGILVERDDQLELHPLARSFLEERGERAGFVASDDVLGRCFDHYWERRDWDAAFDLIVRHGSVERLAALLMAALDELLETARLSTIDTWCALASESGLDGPVFRVARAEVALRHGRHAEAQAHAEAAAEEGSEMTFRAYSVAGRAAHLASREEEGLELYRRAEQAAQNEGEVRDALWGQLRSLIDLESNDARTLLDQLMVGVRFGDPREVVRAAGHALHLQLRFGSLTLDGADRAEELIGEVRDALVESSFLSVYSTALALSARYSEALSNADRLLSVADRYRLEFARPYGLCAVAMGWSGLRHWDRAERSIRRALRLATRSRDAHAEQLAISILIRILAQRGRLDAALAVDTHSVRESLPSSHAEMACSRALALSAVGRIHEAQELVDSVDGITQAVEPAMLAAAVRCICSLKAGDSSAVEQITQFEELMFGAGAVDLLVVAYRTSPELLAVLLKLARGRDRFFSLMRRVGDQDLARLLGHSISADDDPRDRLSAREREVFELLRQGLTNLQIAKTLFIAESTVKLHAHHIYDKLGIRSRTALAIQAALERASQATSATATVDSDDEDS